MTTQKMELPEMFVPPRTGPKFRTFAEFSRLHILNKMGAGVIVTGEGTCIPDHVVIAKIKAAAAGGWFE